LHAETNSSNLDWKYRFVHFLRVSLNVKMFKPVNYLSINHG
jgi:hypothetical protein